MINLAIYFVQGVPKEILFIFFLNLKDKFQINFATMVIEVENREAKIGKSAPNFRCTAVDDEEFVEIELKQVYSNRLD